MNKQIDDTSGSKRKRKPGVSNHEHGTCCICCNPKCADAIAELKLHNPERHGYIELPKKPKPESELVCKPKPADVNKRAMKSQRRRRILEALPSVTKARTTNDGYKSETKFRIASLHFHDNIYHMCKKPDKLQLIDSIPAELAQKLIGMGLHSYQC